MLLSDDKIEIAVNHVIKSVVVKKVILKNNKSVFEKHFSSNMDSLISWSSKVIKDENEELLKFHLLYNQGPFKKMHIAFSKTTGFLNSISYELIETMNEKKNQIPLLIRVSFSNFNSRPKYSDDLFNINAYIRLNKSNQFYPIGLLSNYKILNN